MVYLKLNTYNISKLKPEFKTIVSHDVRHLNSDFLRDMINLKPVETHLFVDISITVLLII